MSPRARRSSRRLPTVTTSALQIKACEDADITAFVPKPMPSNAKAKERFDKSDFIYIAKDDEYRRPAVERAIHRFSTLEKTGLNVHLYWTSASRTAR